MFITIFSILIGVYILAALSVYFLQEKLIFFPELLPKKYIYDFSGEYKELNITTHDGENINALWFKAPDPKGIILFFHGNTGSLRRWADIHRDFTRYGYEVFIYDYRSYGKSSGTISEKNLFKDAFTCYKYVRKTYTNDQIILYGRSLGSGIALQLATKVKPKKVILETPYLSMRDMANKSVPYLPISLILKYPIRSDKFIKKSSCPIHIFHGTEDELIPYEQAVKLSNKRDGITFYTIEGGTHNDLSFYDEYHEHLKKILS